MSIETTKAAQPAQRMSRVRKAMAIAAVAAALSMSAATPAQAAVVSASNGRATVYLSQSETRALAQGSVPTPPAATPWQLKSAYYALAYGHRWFAQQYANRGWCSGFRLSIYPWESQGYFGYACTWR